MLEKDGPKPSGAVCWKEAPAKSLPWKSVERHSLECAAVFRGLLEQFGSFFPLPAGAEFFAAAHDCGKISPGFLKNPVFAEKLPEFSVSSNHEARHELISEAELETFWDFGRDDHAEAIVGWHHGKHKRPGETAEQFVYGGPSWHKERQAFLARMVEETGVPADGISRAMQQLLAGLLCVADWIASDEMKFRDETPPGSIEELMPEARRILADTGFTAPEIRPELRFEDMFPFSPNAAQRVFAETVTGPGVYVLENAMGTGKTEAALYAAYRLLSAGKARGLYFALPTRLTSDRIHLRVNDFLEKIAVDSRRARLLHGKAWLTAPESGGELGEEGDWFHPAKRALLYPYSVGTLDQALLGVLNVKHFFVRLAGLAGKVVIFDEIHSYDIYTNELLRELCGQLAKLGCTVILLSATLSGSRLKEFLGQGSPTGAYPLLSLRKGEEAACFHELEKLPEKFCELTRIPADPETVAATAVDAARQGANVLLISNTVADAQRYYRSIKNMIRDGEFPVGLLHSRFPEHRRGELEAEWIEALGKDGERPDGSILCSTQIVEQSVDIDADLLITEIAPTDMLFQRLGRLWRHEREGRPFLLPHCILIDREISKSSDEAEFKTRAGSAQYVYAPCILYRSDRIWRELTGVTVPGDIRALIEETYRTPGPETGELEQQLYERFTQECGKLAGTAQNAMRTNLYTISFEQENDIPRTRYAQSPSLNILLLTQYEVRERKTRIAFTDGTQMELGRGCFDFSALKGLNCNLVRMARYHFESHPESLPETLKPYFRFEEVLPLLVAGDGRLYLLNGGALPFGYTKELGIFRSELPERKGEYIEYEFEW